MVRGLLGPVRSRCDPLLDAGHSGSDSPGREPVSATCSTASTCGASSRDASRCNQALYLWSKTALPTYILTVLGDRMEMAHSIEGRVPFLDHHLVEVIRSQPVAQKIRGMTEKYVLREAARSGPDRHGLPAAEAPVSQSAGHAQSRPATAHSGAGHSARPGPRVAALLRSRAGFSRLLDQLPTMDEGSRVANDQILMLLLSACVLQERFGLAA